MSAPLAVAFVWHMHQPYYKRSRRGAFHMPWVRMHALKDYLTMVERLSPHPTLHQTFNLVPSLVEQLEDYASGDFSDPYWDLTMKPADELEPEERAFVVDLMCERSSHPRAQRNPRYLELALKKEACLTQGIDACAATFTESEIRDLQVWFNLAWFDLERLHTGRLAELVARDRGFTEQDKTALDEAQAEILARTLPAYTEAAARGQIEITTSPYFHPILPLLINTDLARISRGDVPLPARRFAHPEDAREQIERAVAYHTRTFGRAPRGMWCSEQGIGEDVLPLLIEYGVDWTIGDEGVLARSLGRDITRDDQGHAHSPDLLYRPYRLEREGHSLDVVFRDRVLADLIGFTYRSWGPGDAAANLLWRLGEVRTSLKGHEGPHLVTIALDGENAWEYYPGEGREFLARLYEGLAADPGFRCVTVAEFLAESPPARELPWLHTGSWIHADFSTWIGDPAHSAAWDGLHDARDFVAARRAATLATPPATGAGPATEAAPEAGGAHADVDDAWHHILVAEGSDWFWWFSVHQESGIDHLWDLAFRRHLQDAYRCLGEPPPPELFAPFLSQATSDETGPAAWSTPVIDGLLTTPEEWNQAGSRHAPRAGTMQASETHLVDEVRFACDKQHLYLLFVPDRGGFPAGTRLAVYFGGPPGCGECVTGPEAVHHTRFHGRSRVDAELGFDLSYELEVRVDGPGQVTAGLATVSGGEWGVGRPVGHAAYADVIEVVVPLADLGITDPVTVDFVVASARGDVLAELLPPGGAIRLDLAAIPESLGPDDLP